MTGTEGDHRAGPGDAHAAQERLTREARATASALLDWLGTRVDGAAAPAGSRPPQSPGPCSWCPVCALVAALRGEQPELTARLVEQASGLMMLLRLMMQAHPNPGHADEGHRHDLADLADPDLADLADRRRAAPTPAFTPAGADTTGSATARTATDVGPRDVDPHDRTPLDADPALASAPDVPPPSRPRVPVDGRRRSGGSHRAPRPSVGLRDRRRRPVGPHRARGPRPRPSPAPPPRRPPPAHHAARARQAVAGARRSSEYPSGGRVRTARPAWTGSRGAAPRPDDPC